MKVYFIWKMIAISFAWSALGVTHACHGACLAREVKTQEKKSPAPIQTLNEAEVKALWEAWGSKMQMPMSPTSDLEVMEKGRPKDASAGKALPPLDAVSRPDAEIFASKMPLRLAHHSPEGVIAKTQPIQVVFSHPMIPLSGLSQVDAATPEIHLEPGHPGSWQWVGPQTLIFQPKIPFPMATIFKVIVPAGIQSHQGKILSQSSSWSFETRPLKIGRIFPKQEAILDPKPVFFLKFDQDIDTEKVMPWLSLSQELQQIGLKPLNKKELTDYLETVIEDMPDGFPGSYEFDEFTVENLLNRLIGEQDREKQWIAFRPVLDLLPDCQIALTLEPGAPSAEGPLKTQRPQIFEFRTYPPLQIKKTNLWGRGWQPWIEFNNALDEDSLDPSKVVIDPPLPGYEIRSFRKGLTIKGSLKPFTEYKVSIAPGGFKDRYGQTFAETQTAAFKSWRKPLAGKLENQSMLAFPKEDNPKISWRPLSSKGTVRIYRVDPEDWIHARPFLEKSKRRKNDIAPPGDLIHEAHWAVDLKQEDIDKHLELSPFFEEGVGHLVVQIEHDIKRPIPRKFLEARTWVQKTQLHPSIFSDGKKLFVWVSDIHSGKASANTAVEIRKVATNEMIDQGVTDQHGLLTFPFKKLNDKKGYYLIAKRDGDTAILPELLPNSYGESIWFPGYPSDTHEMYLTDGRDLFTPGEIYRAKGWLRSIDAKRQGYLAIPKGYRVRYQADDDWGNKIAAGFVDLSERGSFEITFDIPRDSRLGDASLEIAVFDPSDEKSVVIERTHDFEIQEYRRPEYSVVLETPEKPFFVDGLLKVEAKARYFTGGPLPGIAVSWVSNQQALNFTPPGWDNFSFGAGQRWHKEGEREQKHEGKTDDRGNHFWQIEILKPNLAVPQLLQLSAAVKDLNGQSWQGVAEVLVHSGNDYVGIRKKSYFSAKGEVIAGEVVVVDLQGRPVSGKKVALQLRQASGTELGPQAGESLIVMSTQEPVAFQMIGETSGDAVLIATVRDQRQRPNETRVPHRIYEGDIKRQDLPESPTLSMRADADAYEVGEIAEIIVEASLQPTQAWAIIQLKDIVKMEPLVFEGHQAKFHLPIEEAYAGGVTVRVLAMVKLSKSEAARLKCRTMLRMDQTLEVSVSGESRRLFVSFDNPMAEFQPNHQASVAMTVRNARANPVPNAEVALFVVDESLLTLVDYQLKNPLDKLLGFGEGKFNCISLLEGLAQWQHLPRLGTATAMTVGSSFVESFGGWHNAENSGIRKAFQPVAAYEPTLKTDSQGRVTASFKLPGSLTRYRIMAIAAANSDFFGIGETQLVAKKQLMLRATPPRFMAFGDQAEITLIAENQSTEDLEVALITRARNLDLESPSGRAFLLPAGQLREIRCKVTANQVGQAYFQAAIMADGHADAVEKSWPVNMPAVQETFAAYGVLPDGAMRQPIVPPQHHLPELGSVTVNVSSSALLGLDDALAYLMDYPYDCSEQLASRMMGLTAFGEDLHLFQDDWGDAVLHQTLKKILNQLEERQGRDGGFNYWTHIYRESDPFVTIHTIQAMIRAKKQGFDIDDYVFERAFTYLEAFMNRSHLENDQVVNKLRAYATYVMHLANFPSAHNASNIFKSTPLDQATVEGLAWLVPSLSKPGQAKALQEIKNRLTLSAATAVARTQQSFGSYQSLSSTTRATAVVLDAFLDVEPDSPLIPKLVRGLLDLRVNGIWSNTQNNAYALMVLARYFRMFESQTPQFTADLWVGEAYVGDRLFSGTETPSQSWDIPLTWFDEHRPTDLLLHKQGEGKLYYRMGMNYVPDDLVQRAQSRGFMLERHYTAVDDPNDVDILEDGTVRLKHGARVKVTLRMKVPSSRFHVALVDSLPAGIEAMNPSLMKQQTTHDSNSLTESNIWFDHQQFRVDQVQAFSTNLGKGDYEYSYMVRATTRGVFAAAAAKAEEMYRPEIFGTSEQVKVIIH